MHDKSHHNTFKPDIKIDDIKIPYDSDLASAIKASMDGIAINNEKREFIYVNNSFIKIYGFKSPNEVIGKNWRMLYDEDEVDRLQKEAEPELFSKGFWRGETIGKKCDGTKFFQEISLTLTNGGRIIRIVRDISARKKVEKALEESEFKYRSLLENLHEVVLYQDNNNIIKYVNKRFCEIFGYTEEELIGTNGYDMLYDKNDIIVINQKNNLREKGISDSYEIKLKKKNGELIWVFIKGTPYYDIGGNIIGSITIISDITEKKRSEAALKETELKFRTVFENSVDAISVSNNGNHIFVNPAYTSLFGYESFDELKEISIYNLLAPSVRERAIKYADLRLEGKSIPSKYETKGIKKDNTEFDIEVHISSYKLYDEVYFIAIIRDITERIKAQQDLKNSEERYRTLVNTSPDAIAVTANDDKITFMNHRALEMFGYNKFSEVIGLENKNLLSPESFEKFENLTHELLEKSFIGNIEFEMLKKDGSVFPVETNASIIKDSDGNINSKIAIFRDISIRKQAEKALKESESKYRSLMENLKEAVLYLDNDAVILYANKQTCELFGYESGELIGINSFDLLYNKNDIELINEKNKYRAQGISDTYEIRCKKKNGVLIWCHISGSPYKDEEGHIIGSMTMITDITEQKKYKDALKESETKFQTIFENSVDAIGVSKNGVTVLINPAFVTLFGYDNISEMEGKSESDLIAPGERSRILEYTKKRVEGGSVPDSYVSKGLRKDKTEFTLEVHVSSYKLIGEIYDVAILRDITELEIAQKALQESEEKYRTLINTSPDAINVVDTEGKILLANQRLVDMFGYDSDVDLIGKSYLELFLTEEEKPKALKTMKNVFKEGYAGNIERNMVKKDGSHFPVEINVSEITDSFGNPKNLIAIIRDITSRKQFEEQLKKYAEELAEMNATKDKLYSIVAHDLRSPFQSLLGYSEMLKSNLDKLNSIKIAKFAENIYETSSETYNLLENLLQWTAIQSGRIKVLPEMINLQNLFDYVVNNCREMARFKNITIESNLKKNLFVYADNNMMTIILRNLLSNAVKFTNRDGKIYLDANEKNNKILICVTDSGVGIPREDISKLFRIDSTYSTRGTEKEKGTGLGLVICKEFAECNHGKLSVHSQPGKGSKFTLSLPKVV